LYTLFSAVSSLFLVRKFTVIENHLIFLEKYFNAYQLVIIVLRDLNAPQYSWISGTFFSTVVSREYPVILIDSVQHLLFSRLLSKNIKIGIYKTTYNFAYGSVWVRNLISDIKGET
jgi:hypothetical protein